MVHGRHIPRRHDNSNDLNLETHNGSIGSIPHVYIPDGIYANETSEYIEESDSQYEMQSGNEEAQHTEESKEESDLNFEDPNEHNESYTSQFLEELYPNSRINLGISILLIATFAIRFKLTAECLESLLTLISVHCVEENR